MKAVLPRTKMISYTAIMIALAISLRILKHALVGPFQFVNFPGVFTILAGVTFGPVTGMVVGFASYLLSDMMIGLPGLWTAVNAPLMAVVGAVSGLIWGWRNKLHISKIGLGISTYVMMFAFDVLASWILWALIGYDWVTALVVSMIGLFIPAGGGFLFAVGPITEAVTAILVVTLVFALARGTQGLLHQRPS